MVKERLEIVISGYAQLILIIYLLYMIGYEQFLIFVYSI
jgi:hypothetical protein